MRCAEGGVGGIFVEDKRKEVLVMDGNNCFFGTVQAQVPPPHPTRTRFSNFAGEW